MGQSEEADRLWTARDVARYLQMSDSWVYKQVESGALPHAKLGARLRFHPARVREFASQLAEGAAPIRSLPAKVIALRRP